MSIKKDEDMEHIQDVNDDDHSGDNRQFTLMSNIIKKMHDVVKTAINNIR